MLIKDEERTVPLVLSDFFLRSRDISITDTGDGYSTEKKFSGLKLMKNISGFPFLIVLAAGCATVSVSREDETANMVVQR
jgi:hypothetical protein